MPKIAVSLRLEPEFVSLLKKIAKEEYGSDSKKGYVVENAISLYHSQRQSFQFDHLCQSILN